MSDEDFQYLVEEFGSQNLMLILTSIGTVLKGSMKKSYLLENIFIAQHKMEIGDDGKVSSGHISIKDYLICEKIWDQFKMKKMGDYHDHYLKKMYCN